MPEEEKKEQEQAQQKEPYAEYIEQINKLKENSVSKEEYQKVQEENRTLLQNLVNGQKPSPEDKPEDKKPLLDLKKETFMSGKINDVDYVQNLLEIRKRVIDEKGYDPFVANGAEIAPTQQDYESAEKVAKVLQECIDSSGGDNAIFVATLQNRMVDVNLPKVKK